MSGPQARRAGLLGTCLLSTCLLSTLLAGCLEQTTGESKPLDPRFVEQTGGGEGGDGVALSGPTVTVRGTVTAPSDAAVDIDLSVEDSSAPGGLRRLGKVLLDQPGPFELKVPAATAAVRLALFQDGTGDGPSADDAYALLPMDTQTQDIDAGILALVVGAWQPPTHTSAAPGAPGGSPVLGAPPVPSSETPAGPTNPTGPAQPAEPLGAPPFAAVEGPLVTLRGRIAGGVDQPVQLDLTLPGPPPVAGHLRLSGPGDFAVDVPRSAGAVSVRAWQDLAQDGRSPDDPVASTTVQVGELDVDGVDLALASGDAPAPPPTAPPSAPPVGSPGTPPGAGPPGAAASGPAAAGATQGGAGAGPFDDFAGPTVVLHGTVSSSLALPVHVDLRQPDPQAEGGVRDVGKVLLAGPGDFAIKVPRGFGDLRLEGFQDPDGNGPGATDPWGVALVDVAKEDVSDVRLMLVAGGRGTGAAHHDVAHHDAVAGAPVPIDLSDVDEPVDPGGVGPFANFQGARVKLRGTVKAQGDGPVDLDLWVEDPAAPGGMRNQGKVVLVSPGSFVLRVPKDAGRMAIEAYQDVDADGPTETDAFARLELKVGAADLDDLALALVATGARGAGVGGGGGGGQAPPADDVAPFSTATGARVHLAGRVRGTHADAVTIDVRVPDSASPGGVRQEGRVHLAAPGAFALEIPVGLGTLELEAFQDTDANGPDDDDPYGRVRLDVGEADLQTEVELVDGGRALLAAAGAPGGGPVAGGAGTETDAFPAYQGERVTVSGTLHYSGEGVVDVDLFKTDPTAPGGRSIAGKLKLPPGDYHFTAPRDFGPLELEAFVDVDTNGPSAGDPVGRYAGNPLTIGSEDVGGVDITITGG